MSTSDQNPNPFRGPAWDELVIALEKTRTGLRVSSPGIDTHAALLRGGHTWQNWAKNQEATPHHWHRPNSEHDVTKVITEARDANEKVRVLGKGYSFSPLVPTDDHIVDVTHMNTCSVDVAQKTVTAGPGTTIDELERALQRKKLCLETAPVIPWVTLGGALGTGVHGTGSAHGTLADLVVEARVVDANSNIHVVKGPQSGQVGNEGRALGCNLGALGVITEVTLQAVDLFNLEVKDDTHNYWLQTTMLSRGGLVRLLKEAPYVSALWWPTTERCWVKKWKRTSAPRSTYYVQYFLEQLGVRLGANVVTKMGKVLADHPAWTPIFAAMLFDEIKHQEYVSPAPEVFHFINEYPMVWNMSYAFDVDGYSDAGIGRAVDAWQALVDILEHYRDKGLFPQNMATHMRHIGSSQSLLSPSTGHNGSVALEVVALQGQDYELWSKFFACVESAWIDLQGRPHWGKLHSWGDAGGEPHNPSKLKEIRNLYPASKLAAFRTVRQTWDPNRMFENRYTAALL